MKITLGLVFLFFTSSIFAQTAPGIVFSLKLETDGVTYIVYAKPTEGTTISTNTITGTGQVTLVAPNDFEITNFKDLGGEWDGGSTIVKHPEEDVNHDYISIGLSGDNNPKIIYKPGETTALFSFESKHGCQGEIRLIDNVQDEFAQIPNSKNSNPKNEIGIIDLGNGLDRLRYIKNEEPYIANCSVGDIDPKKPIEAKVIIDEQGVYHVILKSNETFQGTDNFMNSAQFTLIVPAGGFKMGSIISQMGRWNLSATFRGPSEASNTDYFVVGLSSPVTDFSFEAGKEITIFSFENIGDCTGQVELLKIDDPFFPPNSVSANIGNFISIFGFSGNAFEGDYELGRANCLDDTPVLSSIPAVEIQSDRSAFIQWLALDNVIGYSIQARKKGINEWEAPINVLLPECYFYAPEPGRYEYQIRSIFKDRTAELSGIFELSTITSN